jgi:hypothetical protein
MFLTNGTLYLYWTGWSVLIERRKFFESYAKQNGFDPLIPENWYNTSTKKLLAKKVLFSVEIVLSLSILITNVNREVQQFWGIIATAFQRHYSICSLKCYLTRPNIAAQNLQRYGESQQIADNSFRNMQKEKDLIPSILQIGVHSPTDKS